MSSIKGILSLSGGLDSSTLLSEYKDDIHLCVFFNYGSKQNDREVRAAKAIAEHYNKELVVINVSEAFKDFNSALLKTSKENVELGRYDSKDTCNAKVPFRNGIFLSFLVGLAESRGLNTIFLGVHAGDHRIYPDCTPPFIETFRVMVNEYSDFGLRVVAPFEFFDKHKIAQLAFKNSLPVGLTYSCYLGGEEHCGKCPTCIERSEALGLFQGGM